MVKKNLKFEYNATGQRTAKHVYSSSDVFEYSDYYVYDASGNLMSVYRKFSDANEQVLSYSLTERPMYGSSRVGIDNYSLEFVGYTPPTNNLTSHILGLKQYELTNHLGNVLSTISDQKKPVDEYGNGTIDYYTADVKSSTDYYPFGSPMDGRTFGSEKYRFGFQGQEAENEISGIGNYSFFKYRVSDNRLGRFFAVDPLVFKYPQWSPYQFSGNLVIHYREIEGLEPGVCSPGWHQVAIWKYGDEKAIKTFDEMNFNLAVGGVKNLAVASAFLYNPALALKLSGIGAVISGGYTAINDGDAYSITRDAISGFYGGAVLAFSPLSINSISTFIGVAGAGGLSGMISNISKQSFDNAFGNTDGYNLKDILLSGGVGSVANIVSVGLVQSLSSKIDEIVANSISKTNTKPYQKMITDVVRKENSSLSSREVSKIVKSRITEIQVLIKNQGSQIKAALQQSIETGTDYIEKKLD